MTKPQLQSDLNAVKVSVIAMQAVATCNYSYQINVTLS